MYVTLPPVVEVSVCAMVAPMLAACPVTVPVTVPIVQMNVAPEGVLLNAMLVVAPLQMAAGVTGVTTGGGLIVTVAVLLLAQPFALVTVNLSCTEPLAPAV